MDPGRTGRLLTGERDCTTATADRAAYAAADAAAYAAAYAAYAATDAADAAGRKKSLAKAADIVREYITWEMIEEKIGGAS